MIAMMTWRRYPHMELPSCMEEKEQHHLDLMEPIGHWPEGEGFGMGTVMVTLQYVPILVLLNKHYNEIPFM